MFKIVDDFNGYEEDTLYDTIDAAEEALTARVGDFYEANQGRAQCRLTVVSGECDWYFDPRYNKFIWG